MLCAGFYCNVIQFLEREPSVKPTQYKIKLILHVYHPRFNSAKRYISYNSVH